MSPNNTDYWIFSAKLSEKYECYKQIPYLLRSNHLTSVYILPEYYSIQVSENTIVEDQLPESCAENRLRIRNLPNVFSSQTEKFYFAHKRSFSPENFVRDNYESNLVVWVSSVDDP